MTRTLLLVFAIACSGSSKQPAKPDPGQPACGWRKESVKCTAASDCPADSACVEGLGEMIVPPPRKDGLENQPPYDREKVHFCQPRTCPATDPAAPPTDSGPAPTPEPAPKS